ncbi:stage II sporulation protein M [Ascidiimonas aurantiaca]|uniref:stage II sporulation protein M n=1 Tax=Ascidiimonas aurantiaca TaxID=1685432 RepID=UPI0030EDECB3
MKSNILALLIIIFGMVFYFVFNSEIPDTPTSQEYRIDYDDVKSIKTGIDLLDIFLNNLFVGLMLSLLGFFTGGLLTTLVLFWNGYILAIVYHIGFEVLSFDTLLYYSKHIPLEFFAFILFANTGFKGFYFIKDIILKKKINLKMLPKFQKLLIPTCLLLLAAIIEVL